MKNNKTIDKELYLHDNQQISVFGARVHNLQNIDVNIPRNKLTVITGLSGSGKSSLAFDTIYAEGQRRYVETFASYARKFLGNLERPDVDKINGLSPVISIEQKTTSRSPRSTVGTVTEIYDFLRLLYARASTAYSGETGEKMVQYTNEQIINLIVKNFKERAVYILAPLVRGRKGHYRDLFVNLLRKGFLHVRIDGEIREIKHGMRLDRYKIHHVEMVVDKLIIRNKDIKRLKQSLETAMQHGKGITMLVDKETADLKFFSRHLMCPTTGISYNIPAPHSFSFNSPQGTCPVCKGIGTVSEIAREKIIPNPNLSIAEGGILPLGKYKNSLIFWLLESITSRFSFTLNTPLREISDEAIDLIMNGSDELFNLKNSPLGQTSNYLMSYHGLMKFLSEKYENDESKTAKKWKKQYLAEKTCPECRGHRLKKEALYFRIHDKNIAELSQMDIGELSNWFENVETFLEKKERIIAKEIIKEIKTRLSFLRNVGLSYLSLNRSSRSLSGGESQRIRLASQIGSQLVNVLYILDEPSIGLHQRDNTQLISTLKQLRDLGNSIIVVEHDKEMMLAADHIIDMGPLAGKHGGKVVAAGTYRQILKSSSLTAQYLNSKKQIVIPDIRRQASEKFIRIEGASGNNLKELTVDFPLGLFICVTGVSGSGKSSLLNHTLQPALSNHLYRAERSTLPYKAIRGMEHIDKVVVVDQSPIGRTPRSNPATYTGVFSEIRSLFAKTPESQIRAYKVGRYSFNVKGGRCETCRGAGVQTIEMNFLPDVYVHCEDCNGKRYNRETLEVRYKSKSISDVLEMTVTQGVTFFENIPKIFSKLKALQDVGLGYLALGQASTTLSGGEAQRVKLAAELSKRSTGKTIYMLDEPTTGLHFEDIKELLAVLNRLVEKGNTVIVIEHNLDVIKTADYIIDIGKEGGEKGGEIVATGTPEELAKNPNSYTGHYLREELKR